MSLSNFEEEIEDLRDEYEILWGLVSSVYDAGQLTTELAHKIGIALGKKVATEKDFGALSYRRLSMRDK